MNGMVYDTCVFDIQQKEQISYPLVQVSPDIVHYRSNKDKASHKNHSKGCMKVGVCAPHASQEGPQGIK